MSRPISEQPLDDGLAPWLTPSQNSQAQRFVLQTADIQRLEIASCGWFGRNFKVFKNKMKYFFKMENDEILIEF